MFCALKQQFPVVERMSAIMLFVYGDESMDETKQRVCAVAGVLGNDEEWKRFEPLWKARNGDIPFHAKDCETDHGDYAARDHAENQALYKDLTILLAESSLVGYAAISDLAAQRRYYPDFQPIYYREFSLVIDAMQHVAKTTGELAEMCFDSRAESDFNAGMMYAQSRELIPEYAPFIASKISFESSSKNPRIQVADLFAREAMKLLDNQVGPVRRKPRKSWQALEATGRFHTKVFDDEFFAYEKRFFEENISRNGARFEEYRAWLSQHNRQHNMTNLIWFTLRNPWQ